LAVHLPVVVSGLEKEGLFDARLLLAALKAKAASFGVNFVNGEVVGFASKSSVVQTMGGGASHRVRRILTRVHVRCDSDEKIYPVQFAFCFNCAGPWSRDIARLAGIGTGDDALAFDLPIVPR
jgi:FAD-dependent oxidoreductase domain-containing protein 1